MEAVLDEELGEEVQGEAVLAVLESGTDDEVLEDVEHEEAVLDGDLLEDVNSRVRYAMRYSRKRYSSVRDSKMR